MKRELLPQHRQELKDAGLSDECIDSRVSTGSNPQDLRDPPGESDANAEAKISAPLPAAIGEGSQDEGEIGPQPSTSDDGIYECNHEGTFKRIPPKGKGSGTLQKLANFQAEILEEWYESDGDDGPELLKRLLIKTICMGEAKEFTLSIDEFRAMEWHIKHIGTKAVILVSYRDKDILMVAIQLTSKPKKVKVFRNSGWTSYNEKQVFVHAEGIIEPDPVEDDWKGFANRDGSKSPEEQGLAALIPISRFSCEGKVYEDYRVEVDPHFVNYRLPSPPSGEQELLGMIALIMRDFMKIGPSRIMYPLFAAIWLTAMSPVRFSIFIYGATGQLKTGLALLMMKFFGPRIGEPDLANWGSTANALLELLYQGKNVIETVDDFGADEATRERDAKIAAVLFRSQGNQASKHRCRSDGSLRPSHAPRGMLIATGETLTLGTSLNARLLPLEIREREILDPEDQEKMDRLVLAQKWGENGVYAGVMAAYLKWFANNFKNLSQDLEVQTQHFSKHYSNTGFHGRTVEILGCLRAAFQMFGYFLQDIGWGEDEVDLLLEDCDAAFQEVILEHKNNSYSEDPARRFIEFLISGFQTGKVHLEVLDQDLGSIESLLKPSCPSLWGYGKRVEIVESDLGPTGSDSEAEEDDNLQKNIKITWFPRGEQIGYIRGGVVLLEPQSAIAFVNRLASAVKAEPISMGVKALGKRLKANSALLGGESDRNCVRVKLKGHRLSLLPIPMSEFYEECFAGSDYYGPLYTVEELQKEKETRQQELLKLTAPYICEDFLDGLDA